MNNLELLREGEESFYEVYPETAEEVKAVLQFANSEKRTVSWKTCSSTFPPQRLSPDNSILINVSNMKAIEVNETSRFAVIGPGVTHGELTAYLEENHPDLMHCLIGDSPDESVTATAVTCGRNSLATLFGSTSDMIQGLEVVLPDSTIATIGTGCVSPYWFASGPLPEFRGIFLNWDGTMGIITKLSLRLFCVPQIKDFIIYTMRESELLPEVIEKITHTEMVDQLCVIGKGHPAYMKGLVVISLQLSANTQDELSFKKDVFKSLFSDNKKLMYKDNLPEAMYEVVVSKPVSVTNVSMKVSHFVNFFVPPETIPAIWNTGKEIMQKHGGELNFDFAVIDHGHHVMGTIACILFENTDDSFTRSEALLLDLESAIIDLGGIIRGVTSESYKLLLQKMDPCTRELFNRFRSVVDPNGIMKYS